MKKNYTLLLLLLSLVTFPVASQESPEWNNWLQKKQYHKIISAADSLTAGDSINIAVIQTIGDAYAGLLNQKKAYEVYQYCYVLDSTNLDLLTTLGSTALSLGKVSEAEGYFGQVLQADSVNFFVIYQLAQLNSQIGDYEKAIGLLQQLRNYYPENAQIIHDMGNNFLKMNVADEAFVSFSEAYNLNQENPMMAASVINMLLRSGASQAKFALSICDTALAYSPNNRTLLQYKAMALYMKEEYVQADSAYTFLLEAKDSSYMTLKYGGASKYYRGLYFNAIPLLEAAYVQDTNSVEVCMLLGAALGKTYDRKRAFALFDRAEEKMKPPREMVEMLARFRAETMEKSGQRQDAQFLYYQLWEDAPDDGLKYLRRIASSYAYPAVYQYPNDEARERGLFINTLYAGEYLRLGADSTTTPPNKKALQAFYDYLLAQGKDELPMFSPDSVRTTLSSDSLSALLNRLPEQKEPETSGIETREDFALNFYKLWKEKPADIYPLLHLVTAYKTTDQSYITREEDRGLILFVHSLYASEWQKLSPENKDKISLPQETIWLLESFYNYMTEKGLEELPMIAPDEKRSRLKKEELKALLDQILPLKKEVKPKQSVSVVIKTL